MNLLSITCPSIDELPAPENYNQNFLLISKNNINFFHKLDPCTETILPKEFVGVILGKNIFTCVYLVDAYMYYGAGVDQVISKYIKYDAYDTNKTTLTSENINKQEDTSKYIQENMHWNCSADEKYLDKSGSFPADLLAGYTDAHAYISKDPQDIKILCKYPE